MPGNGLEVSAILFPNALNALMDCGLGAATHSSDFRIAEIIQRIEQKPLPLGIGAEGQHRQNFIYRFPMADLFLRVAQ